MQKLPLFVAIAFAFGAAMGGSANAQLSTNDTEAAYALTINKRAADIVSALNLSDGRKSKRVHETLVAQYRALNAWHEQHDVDLKALNKSASSDDQEAAAKAKQQASDVQATLKMIHDSFLARLKADLTPEQIETVKDKMTYGKVQFTYAGFLQAVPDMTEEEKAHVLGLLKEARELAIDGGSAEEKTAIFGKYKGKINNYLSSRGHDIGGKSKSQPAQP